MDECSPETACEGQVVRAKTVGLAQRLSQQEKDCEERLADLKRAKEILANNKDLEELLTIFERTGRRLF